MDNGFNIHYFSKHYDAYKKLDSIQKKQFLQDQLHSLPGAGDEISALTKIAQKFLQSSIQELSNSTGSSTQIIKGAKLLNKLFQVAEENHPLDEEAVRIKSAFASIVASSSKFKDVFRKTELSSPIERTVGVKEDLQKIKLEPQFQTAQVRFFLTQIMKGEGAVYLTNEGYTYSKQSIIGAKKLEPIQIYTLLKILIRLSKMEVTKKDAQFLKQLEDNSYREGEILPSIALLPLSFLLRPAPTNEQELIANLELLASRYPRYQLGNNLEVYDSAFHSMPNGTDSNVIRAKLKEQREQIKSSSHLDPSIKERLLSSLNLLIDELKPTTITKMALLIETGSNENGFLLFRAEKYVENKIPFVTTKQLITIHKEKFEQLFVNSDLFVQEEGGLILVMPKGASPQSLGFRLESKEAHFVLWDKPLSEITVLENANLFRGLKNLLSEDTEEQRFERIILLDGHGSPQTAWRRGQISGINSRAFPEWMALFEEKKTAFLSVMSCYAGGENITSVHVNHRQPFPVLVNSATEQVSYGGPNPHFMDSVERSVFQKSYENDHAPRRRQLTRSDAEQIAKAANEDVDLHSLGTFFVSSSIRESARIPFIADWQGKTLDLKTTAKKSRKSGGEIPVFVDDRNDRQHYLFSDPVTILNIQGSSSSIGFAGTGGTAHHFIPSVALPNASLLKIAESTFDKRIEDQRCFLIGSLTCQYDGRVQKLTNVAFIKFGADNRIIFKEEGTDHFTLISYTLGENNAELVMAPSKEIGLKGYCWELYRGIENTIPPENRLRAMSLTQQQEDVFDEAVNDAFWKEKAPLEALFFKVYFSSLDEAERNSELKKLIAQIPTLPAERKKALLDYILNNRRLSFYLKGKAYTMLEGA